MTFTRPKPALLGLMAVTGVLLVVLLWSRHGDGREGRGGRDQAIAVKVARVGEATFYDSIEALGTAQAREAIKITASVSERVSHIAFQDSTVVKAGDTLIALTSREEGAALQEARATLNAAQQDYARSAELVKRGNAAPARLETSKAGRDVARAKLNTMEARLEDRIVRAPFAGIVGLRMVSLGQLLQPGDVITTLDDISVIKADFPVPERFLTALMPGLDIAVTTGAYPERSFSGIVTAVDSRVNENTRAITVRAEIQNPDAELRPGMLLVVDIHTAQTQSLAIPESAVVPLAETMHVFRVTTDGKAESVDVVTGRRQNGKIEILGGLKPGEIIVTEGSGLLQPGQSVKVMQPANKNGEPVASRDRQKKSVRPSASSME